ncbi:hypothetical protein C3942_07475 [Solimonas fluminis]|uniref:Uncharacterized protein n=1 Tax=Solimonas fluminis TaxID=2086571 RepID=A0A2S5THY0_9GAMM|nr:hypothetical protein [Solimonas fluminis]PPE74594.1 hypothetical protein C3942_07475 [Solimonas fluminis]
MSRRYPRNIQKQIAAANELEAQLAQPGPDPAAAPAPEVEPVPAVAPADEPAAEAALPDPGSTPDYWHARFRTTEGVLRKEREERAREQQDQAAQLQQMQRQLAGLQGQIDAGRDPLAGLDLAQHFSAEQIEHYGEDHLRAVLRAAQRTLQPQLQNAMESSLAPLRQELEDTRERVAQTQRSQQQGAYDGFIAELARQVPEWEQVNADPRFLAYLAEHDEATGEERQALLYRLEQRRDAGRVARVFRDYLRGQGARPGVRDPSKRLLPDGSPDGGNPPPDPRPAMSQAQIRQFQADVARGRYRGRAQEQAAMQQRIDEAYMAGRIA